MHKYGVLPDNSPSAAPKNLIDALQVFDHSVFGDYEVCPLTREIPGSMTMVCIQSARNLIVTEYGSNKIVRKRMRGDAQ
jgi:hypothetical protein